MAVHIFSRRARLYVCVQPVNSYVGIIRSVYIYIYIEPLRVIIWEKKITRIRTPIGCRLDIIVVSS